MGEGFGQHRDPAFQSLLCPRARRRLAAEEDLLEHLRTGVGSFSGSFGYRGQAGLRQVHFVEKQIHEAAIRRLAAFLPSYTITMLKLGLAAFVHPPAS